MFFKGIMLEIIMHKGLLSSLCNHKWLLLVLLVLLVTGCNPNEKPESPESPESPEPPEPPVSVSEVTVTGKIMLGPVVRGHSLQLVIYDADMKELDRPKVGLDGSYGFKLKDYKGVIIAQVTSENHDQCSGDYIDEATAKPKCLGKNAILSSTHVQSGTSDNQAKLHTTPVTTVAVLHAGVALDANGGLTIPKGLTQDRIIQSNKAVAKVFGLGDQSIAEYTPTSIITTDQKFKTGDAYTKALAAISGVEAIDSTKNLNNVLKKISSAISTDSKNPALNPALQDMMVKGLQKVAEKIKANSGDKTILKNLSEYQDKFPKSILAVDLTKTPPEPPKLTKATKRITRNNKPTWDWTPNDSETVNYRYQYRIGENDRSWKQINTASFTPSEDYTEGLHTLIIRQADLKNPDLWSKPTKLTIEINKPPKIITRSLELKSATEDKLYSTQLKFKDPDSQKLYVTINTTDKNDWLSFSNNKKSIYLEDPINGYFLVDLKGTAKDKHISKGMEQENIEIKITVNDNVEAQSISENLSIKLINFDDDGQIKLEGIPNQKVTLRAIVSDEDGFSEISYQWKINSKDILDETNETITLTQQHTRKKISVVATYIDGRSKIPASANSHEKEVKDINDKPSLLKNKASINKTLITYEDNEFSNEEFKFIDVDSEDTLTYTFKNLPDWIDQDAYRKARILKGTPKNKDVGKKENIKITARDEDGEQEDITFSIEVLNVNDKPEITKIEPQTVKEGDSFSYQVVVTDVDSDPKQSFELTFMPEEINGSEIKNLITIDNQGKITLEKAPDLESSKDISVTVHVDDTLQKNNSKTEETFTLTIEAVNSPSEITSKPMKVAKVGEKYSYKIEVEDTDSEVKVKKVGATPNWLEVKKRDNTYFLEGTPESNHSKMENKVKLTTHDNITQEFMIDIFEEAIVKIPINICFSADYKVKNYTHNSKPIYQSHKDRIKQVVENTWGKNSAIEFKGWDKECPTGSDSEEVTKIYIQSEGYIKEERMKRSYYSPKKAMIVFYQYFNREDDSLKNSFPAEIAHDTVHEFGHLLGFPHEHERLDTYRHGDFSSKQPSGSYFTDQSELLHICNHITYAKPVETNDTDNVYYFNSEGEKKRRDQKLKLISYKDWQKSSYDPFSIMNYCEGAFDYQYMRVADSAAEQNKKPRDIASLFPTLTLSYEDKKRLQRFYGAPIADNQKHLLKNGVFFTGLFKDVEGDESSYRYYENGVKTKFYNTKLNNEQTDSINLSKLTDDQYFYLHSSLPLANYKYNRLSRTYRNKTLYRYQKGRIFIEAESYQIAICDMDKDKPIDQAGGELNCVAMLDDKTHPNYSFYYFDGPYDLLRETQIQFCEKNKTQNTFTLNERSFSLIDTNRCYDFNPLKNLYIATKQIRLLFVNGETFNGKLNGFSQPEYISLGLMKEDGLFNNKGINIIRKFEAQFYWNLVAKSKYLPETPDFFVDESSIRNIPFTGIWNDSGEKFINNGIVVSNFEQITHSYKWSHPQSNNQSINLQRQAIMAKLDDKLYMDGLLFTGEYKNKVYSKGVEIAD
jgi:hypothetical protein